jgi:acetoin utilization protein AcuB
MASGLLDLGADGSSLPTSMYRTMPLISEYMTFGPHSVEVHDSLSSARRLMREFRVRHLPVMHKGELVGMLSEHDANFVEGLVDAPAETITVEDAMTSKPYVVSPDAPLDEVASVMMERRIGSAVVMDGNSVVGVFTTTDALRALTDALRLTARSTAPD